MKTNKVCLACGQEFEGDRRAYYCSKACALVAKRQHSTLRMRRVRAKASEQKKTELIVDLACIIGASEGSAYDKAQQILDKYNLTRKLC